MYLPTKSTVLTIRHYQKVPIHFVWHNRRHSCLPCVRKEFYSCRPSSRWASNPLVKVVQSNVLVVCDRLEDCIHLVFLVSLDSTEPQEYLDGPQCR